MATKLAGRGTTTSRARHQQTGKPSRARAQAGSGEKTATRVSRAVARGATRARLPMPRRWRQTPMESADVVQVVDALAAAGVRHWLVGGWGVDALLGAQTRIHDDLDLAIGVAQVTQSRAELAAAGDALEALGYRPESDAIHLGAWFPERLTYRHRSGRRVDLLPIDDFPAELFATGRVAEREVGCLSVETQLRMHTGYVRTSADHHDVALLCERFGVECPRPERKMEPGWR